jgi:protease-4
MVQMSFILRFIKFIFKYILFTLFLGGLFYGFTLLPKRQKENAILTVRIENSKLEDNQQQMLPFMKKGYSVEQLRQIIKSAARDPKIKGLVLELYGAQMGLGQVDELAKQLALFKAQKKPVFVFSDTLGGECGTATAVYLLASYADEIYVSPAGMVNFNGFAMSRYFLKSLFDQYAIKGTVERRDEYKGIVDQYLFDEFSKPVRENVTVVLQNIMDVVMAEVAKNRKIPPEKVKELVNQCPLWGAQPVKEKLTDGALYLDQDNPPAALQKIIKDTGAKFISAKKYPLYPQDKHKEKIAVIYLSGQIVRHAPGMSPFNEQPISDFWVQKLLNRASKEKYKAVVLRVNSGGGDSLASSNIHNSVQQFRRKKIPVVMSMGDVCASAAYDMASATDYIVAHPSTITGSIGVACIRPYFKDFAKKFNVNFDGITIGDNATFFNATYELTEEQKERLRQYVDFSYDEFLQKVSDARKIDKEKLRKDIAGGRIWSGQQAKDLGLVDELGGLDMAVTKAADLAKVAEYEVVVLPTGGIADVIAELQDTGVSSMMLSNMVSQFHTMTEQACRTTTKAEMNLHL